MELLFSRHMLSLPSKLFGGHMSWTYAPEDVGIKPHTSTGPSGLLLLVVHISHQSLWLDLSIGQCAFPATAKWLWLTMSVPLLQTALERCREYAMDWVSAAETRVPAVNATGLQLRHC